MKRGADVSSRVLLTALMLSASLAFISNASVLNAARSTLGSLSQFVTRVPPSYLSSCIDEAGKNGSSSFVYPIF